MLINYFFGKWVQTHLFVFNYVTNSNPIKRSRQLVFIEYQEYYFLFLAILRKKARGIKQGMLPLKRVLKEHLHKSKKRIENQLRKSLLIIELRCALYSNY